MGHNSSIQIGREASTKHDIVMTSNRIKSARIASGLSQQAAASALEIGQSFLSKVERGDKRPSVELLSQMARLYGVSETHLIGRQPPVPVSESRAVIDDNAPPGLQALAADRAITEALGIDAEEWRVLRSLDMPAVTKGGYVQLLSTIRGIRDQSTRHTGRPTSVPTQDEDEGG